MITCDASVLRQNVFPKGDGAQKSSTAQLSGWAVKSSKEEKERHAVKLWGGSVAFRLSHYP
jgi:hypothetical protein